MKTFLHPVTPAEFSPAILALSQQLVPGCMPAYVETRPLADAPSKECFPLVEETVRTNGGTSVIGWAIWEQPKLFVEAEFHSVWRSPSNELFDITPRTHPTEKLLFLVDANRIYTGQQVNNVRQPLSRQPEVAAFLQASDDEYEFLNRGDRANQHGEIAVSGAEAREYEEIQQRKARHYFAMLKLHPKVEPYDPCLCGSGKRPSGATDPQNNAV